MTRRRRCSRSTATRSPTAPTTRCRSRSADGRPARERARRLRQLPAAAVGGRAAGRRCSSAGTRSRRRPTATRRCPPTSRGACSRTRSSSSSPCCRRSSSRSASLVGEGAAATRPTTSSPPRPRTWPGPVLVATSDRDAFQLVSDRVTVLQPVKGVSELARIGPAEVRERYGVEPRAGARLHRAARRLVGPHPRRARRRARRRRPTCCASTARSRRRSPTAASRTIADDLRLYRRIATMDAGAPLPELARDAARLGARRGARVASSGSAVSQAGCESRTRRSRPSSS